MRSLSAFLSLATVGLATLTACGPLRIVETPAQAFNTFSRSEMDVLYLGNYVIVKDAKKIIDSTPFMLRHEGDRVAEMVS